MTTDLDIVHRRTAENVARLLDVLHSLDATMRYDFARRGLRPTADMLAGKGQISVPVIASLLGHSSTRMVEKVYGRLSAKNMDDAIAVPPVFGAPATAAIAEADPGRNDHCSKPTT